MKRTAAKAIALAVVLACLMPSLVSAQDYITDATEALQSRSVYVAPNAESADPGIASELEQTLTGSDHIILVMLPASAAEDLDLQPTEIAATISELLGDQNIIGLAVGDTMVGYSTFLPSNVAPDMMRRASEVSRGPVKTLITFVNYVHGWVAQNPDQKPTPTPVPTPTPEPAPASKSTKDEGSNWPFMVGGVMVLALVGGAIQFRRRQLHQVPPSVQGLLEQIALKRQKVRDHTDRENLTLIQRYVERYFRTTSKDRKGDTAFFEKNLADINKYLGDIYLDVQEGPQFWTDPEAALALGSRHFSEFRDHLLNSIRRGTDQKIPEFRQITNESQALYRLTDDDSNGLDDFERRLQSDNN